jgi:hypothetical protein
MLLLFVSKGSFADSKYTRLMQENVPCQNGATGSEPLLEKVSHEVGSRVHMIWLGAVLPSHLVASHLRIPTILLRAWGKWCLPVQVGEISVK